MRNQPIPDSVRIIEDSKLPALSVMTFERVDGMYEHHMTIQRKWSWSREKYPTENARWYTSLVTTSNVLPGIKEFPPERVYQFEGYAYEFAWCHQGCLHRMETHNDGMLRCDAHPWKKVIQLIVQDVSGSVNGALGSVVCWKCNAWWD